MRGGGSSEPESVHWSHLPPRDRHDPTPPQLPSKQKFRLSIPRSTEGRKDLSPKGRVREGVGLCEIVGVVVKGRDLIKSRLCLLGPLSIIVYGV